MLKDLHSLVVDNLANLNENDKNEALASLESGRVVYFPNLSFEFNEVQTNALLRPDILDGKHKNISFDYQTQKLGGFKKEEPQLVAPLAELMQNYAEFARQLVDTTFPQYQSYLLWGRTSYRPAEIKGRPSSKRKDDTRLHVDSFPASPVNGKRILRVFCNVNPNNHARIWHLGEPFEVILERFAKQIPAYNKTLARLLKWTKTTKSLRSAYDHYQLKLHDTMKLDDDYQTKVNKNRIDFPALSTWVVFTDEVSHAALGGQFLLEQTFYLPVDAMATPALSPLKRWEKLKDNNLA
ncbi:MAG: Kdo hydroxylase family protein [Proteobacteria bacterium]|nr:Kdo hydroxylase family protein [Pseudomonadota bacterium]